RATSALLDVLAHGTPALQPLAADALIYVADAAAVTPLLQLATGDPRGPRLEAARALGGVLRGRHDERARRVLEHLADGDSLPLSLAAIAALGAMGDKAAVGKLGELARGFNPHRQRAAAEALGNLGDRDVVPLLVDLLGAGDDRVSAAAAWALGKLGDPRAVAPLLAAVPRRGWATAVNASAALARLAPREPKLADLLRHRDRLVRINGCAAVAATGIAAATPRLIELLARDAAAEVRVAAARALTRLPRTDEITAALKTAATADTDPAVRAAAGADKPFAPPARRDWQAFRFVDPDQGDAPVRQEPYFILAADGLATALYTDERGEAIEEQFPPGDYQIEGSLSGTPRN
ncbi:MAG TPA: HEAT repeat domain-containing protein, partial [Kofleriaceae bacterium]|nr:HEAT repeat domain-containing protein [Kofleriaceae bacterium]